MATVVNSRNATYGLVTGLNELLQSGQHVLVRGSAVTELRNHVTVMSRPRERCIITPHRQNNIFATIAETVWVMAGRNDLAYLTHYLPRVGEFSDDGQIWRAGYGPRLRNWHGTDQLQEVISLLKAEPTTRRAVMSIFDPAIDYQDSKDIPCNNWLDWLIRDGKLHLSVAIRSNDAIWGFSGINSFEWSVLQEMMAYWAGVEVGDVTFFASSFHVYDRHLKRAQQIVQAFNDTTWYSTGASAPRFSTAFKDFDDLLRRWFAIESMLRVTPAAAGHEIARFSDPLYQQFLAMLQLYNGLLQKCDDQFLAQCIAAMPENDLTAAACEHLHRHRPTVISLVQGHHTIKQWLAANFEAKETA